MSKSKPKTTGGSFISFSQVTSSSSYNSSPSSTSSTPSSSILSPVYTGDDAELAVSSKKLLKKDSVTKLKAMAEIQARFSSIASSSPSPSSSSQLLVEFLPYFSYVYIRLSLDNDRKVRQQLNATLSALIEVDKQALGPHTKVLIGPWWVACSDPSPEVSSSAIAAFHAAIPPKKRSQVLVYLAATLFQTLARNFAHTPESLSDFSSSASCTKEESDERYERVVISSIDSIGRLMSTLTDSDNDKLLQGIELSAQDHLVNAMTGNKGNQMVEDITGYPNILSEKFWKKLSSKRDMVRKASYQLFSLVCRKIPRIFESMDLSRITSFVCKALDESFEPNLVHMYDAVLAFLSNVKGCWDHIDIVGSLIPALKQQVKTHPRVALEHILAIIGCIPSTSFTCWVKTTSLPSSSSESINVADAEAETRGGVGDKGHGKKNKPSSSSSSSSSSQHTVVEVIDDLLDFIITFIDGIANKNANTQSLITNANVCICEACTLVLLRRHEEKQTSHGLVNEIAKRMARRFIDSAKFIIQAAVDKQDESETNAALTSLKRVFTQLQRGTLKEINFSSELWSSLLWTPLSQRWNELFDAYYAINESNLTMVFDMYTSLGRLTQLTLDVLIECNVDAKEVGVDSAACSGSSFICSSIVTNTVNQLNKLSESSSIVPPSINQTLHSLCLCNTMIAIHKRASHLISNVSEITTTTNKSQRIGLSPDLPLDIPKGVIQAMHMSWIERVSHFLNDTETESRQGIKASLLYELQSFVSQRMLQYFQYLASVETFSSNSLCIQDILSHCFRAASMPCLTLVLQSGLIMKHDWQTSKSEACLVWIRNILSEILNAKLTEGSIQPDHEIEPPPVNTTCLTQNMSIKSKVSFAVLCTTRASTLPFHQSIISIARASWLRNRHKISLWVLLSVSACKASGSVDTDTMNANKDSNLLINEEALKLIASSDQEMVDLLVRLFFNRDRDQARTSSSSSTSSLHQRNLPKSKRNTNFASSSDECLPSFECIISWDDVVSTFLPRLPARLLKAFEEKVVSELGKYIYVYTCIDVDTTRCNLVYPPSPLKI